MKRTIVISPATMKPFMLQKQLSCFLSEEELGNSVHLTFTSTHFDIDNTDKSAAHIFTPLDDSFGRIFITKQFPVLYANHFTLSWLALTLYDLGAGGEVFLEIPNEKTSIARGQMTPNYIKKFLPKITIDRINKEWVRIGWNEKLKDQAQNLKTVYTYFHRAFNDFHQAINDAPQGRANFDEASTRYYIYSLSGANQKSFLCEKFIDEYLTQDPLNICDLGGGLGFLAADLSLKGHTVNVMDYNPLHVYMCGWMAERCGVADRFTSSQGDFHDMVASMQRESYDTVSYFGSLLYTDRNQTPDIIKASMRMLKAQGLLLVHEGPRESASPNTADYKTRFHAEELKNLLEKNAGKPNFYNVFNGLPMPWEQIKNKVIMTVVQKDD